MELTKNKKRAVRRKRNLVAKAVRQRRGGPMEDKKPKKQTREEYNEMIEEMERHSIDQKELDLDLTTGLFRNDK